MWKLNSSHIWGTFKYKSLKKDREAFGTTFVDYYALPADGVRGWPGRSGCAGVNVSEKAAHIQYSLSQDFETRHGPELATRFIPFVTMYEFEGLLFSDPALMARSMGESGKADRFTEIRNSFETPEHINDSPDTAPSRRINNLVPGYNKVARGNRAAKEVTLERMRQECPVFAAWVTRMEDLTI